MSTRRTRRSLALMGLLVGAVLIGAAPASAAAPAPTGNFLLKGNYKNAAGTSLALAPIGAPAFQAVTVGGKNRQALVFAVGDGLTLTGIAPAARTTYTIDLWFELDDVASYQRVLSFGPNDTDDGFYLYNGGPDIYPQSYQSAALVAANTWTHLRITRSAATKRAMVYTNGNLTNVVIDLTNALVLRQGTVVFFKDESGSDDPSGTVASIRIWNKVVAP
jgi:hypothetical protein